MHAPYRPLFPLFLGALPHHLTRHWTRCWPRAMPRLPRRASTSCEVSFRRVASCSKVFSGRFQRFDDLPNSTTPHSPISRIRSLPEFRRPHETFQRHVQWPCAPTVHIRDSRPQHKLQLRGKLAACGAGPRHGMTSVRGGVRHPDPLSERWRVYRVFSLVSTMAVH